MVNEGGVRHRHSHHGNLEAAQVPGSALSRLVPWIGLVDDVDSSLPADDPAALVALLQCLQRIDDLHIRNPGKGRNIGSSLGEVKSRKPVRFPLLCYAVSPKPPQNLARV